MSRNSRPGHATDHPFRGYKVAQLVVGPGDAWLAGVMGAQLRDLIGTEVTILPTTEDPGCTAAPEGAA